MSIWSRLFGPVSLDPSIWPHLFKPVYLRRTHLFGSVYCDLYIWTRLFGLVCLDPSIWTHLFGLVCWDPSIYIVYCSFDCNKPAECQFLFVNITSECFSSLLSPFRFYFHLTFHSHVYLNPFIWTRLFGPVCLDLSIWTRLLSPVYLAPSN